MCAQHPSLHSLWCATHKLKTTDCAYFPPCDEHQVTNPGFFDGEGGRLKVAPYHPLNEHPHGCPNCPTNLCKGAVLTKWLEELAPGTKVLYVGDGSGDFCPALRLDEASVVMARSEPHDRLLRLCESARAAGDLRASLVVWNADDGGASLLRGIEDFLG